MGSERAIQLWLRARVSPSFLSIYMLLAIPSLPLSGLYLTEVFASSEEISEGRKTIPLDPKSQNPESTEHNLLYGTEGVRGAPAELTSIPTSAFGVAPDLSIFVFWYFRIFEVGAEFTGAIVPPLPYDDNQTHREALA